MRTITIAGGGLAGLSLGVGLRGRGVPVVLQEAGSYPRHRVCGEFINGVRGETLERLGVAAVFRGARRLRSTCWNVGETRVHEAELPEAAMGISRFLLDQRLADEFERLGGELQPGMRAERTPREGLVWAAGRKPDPRSQWLGLKIHLRDLEMTADLEMHVGTRGYIGLAPVENERVNACGLFRRKGEIKGSGPDLLWNYLAANGQEELSKRLRRADPDHASFTGVSAFHLGRQEEEEGLCRLGDAESMIPPFTGNGMSMAFEAAESALGLLVAYAENRTSWDDTRHRLRSALRHRFRRRLATARLLHPFLLSSPGRSALGMSARSGMLPFQLLFRLLR